MDEIDVICCEDFNFQNNHQPIAVGNGNMNLLNGQTLTLAQLNWLLNKAYYDYQNQNIRDNVRAVPPVHFGNNPLNSIQQIGPKDMCAIYYILAQS
jgi:hypothetical protein